VRGLQPGRGTPTSDARFQVFLHGYAGSMRHFSEVYGLQAAFGPARAELDSDAQPETWEPICIDVAITVPVDYFAIELRAIENTVDGPPGDEFDGHFVDDACLFVNPR